MKKVFGALAAVVFVAAGATQASAETWKGTISDSMCGVKHSADKHGDKAADHRACVEKCIKDGGSYTFLAGDKVFKIANQKFAGLKAHAGHEVSLTGTAKEDTITVSKIAMPKAEKAK